jgi:hypothetical protein
MPRYPHTVMLAVVSSLWCGVSASAETLRCQSLNGNINCAGSSGASCQTVDGKTVCTSGHGDVVQSFGGASKPDVTNEDANEPDWNDLPPAPAVKERLQQRGPAGHSVLLQRDGNKLHLRTDWVSVDRN